MKQGDLVTRRSYDNDIVFKIQDVIQRQALLRGVDYRLLADAPLSDLLSAPQLDSYPPASRVHPPWMDMIRSNEVQQMLLPSMDSHGAKAAPNESIAMRYFEIPGKVLHLDGDPAYLRKCMNLYGELRVPAEGFYVSEIKMAEALYRLLPQTKPDILVITGHDGILKNRRSDMNQLGSYKNSYHFVQAVKVARQYEKNKDELTIIAGACQSHFEALLQAGANYASSPARVLIHALDPLCVAAKVAFTPIRDTVNVAGVIGLTHSGFEGMGGIESRGSFRRGVPQFQ
ncbi:MULTISPECIES: sporulation peptidase YabG [Paenibacillus]|uniref:Sporulation peptidase YabG n=1 Tax=Paenibacillus baimaensis TaxID=2982185 RepID=A0ABT2UJU3_9BACL|nr:MULTISPECIES: sporulation peptidase YabG [unclassified Paenibacillus]MCU6794887.1 sporulation peptidase YabG [Paenibacillus sp. WQ 127069]OMF03263.1 sporulation peptidase YabG [Paenibacillus sp. FSL H7-0331]